MSPFSSFRLLSPATLVAAVPIAEFLLDLALDRIFGDIPGEAMVLIPDSRAKVRQFQQDKDLVNVIRTFVDFGLTVQESIQGTIRTAVIAAVSLLIALHTSNSPTGIYVIVLGTLFLITIAVVINLLYKLWRGRLDPARVGEAGNYKAIALILTALAIVFDQLTRA